MNYFSLNVTKIQHSYSASVSIMVKASEGGGPMTESQNESGELHLDSHVKIHLCSSDQTRLRNAAADHTH